MTLNELTELLSWVSLINILYLSLAGFLLIFTRRQISQIHQKLFNMGDAELGRQYFRFLGHYKIVTMAFFVAPYLALKIMGY